MVQVRRLWLTLKMLAPCMAVELRRMLASRHVSSDAATASWPCGQQGPPGATGPHPGLDPALRVQPSRQPAHALWALHVGQDLSPSPHAGLWAGAEVQASGCQAELRGLPRAAARAAGTCEAVPGLRPVGCSAEQHRPAGRAWWRTKEVPQKLILTAGGPPPARGRLSCAPACSTCREWAGPSLSAGSICRLQLRAQVALAAHGGRECGGRACGRTAPAAPSAGSGAGAPSACA